MSTAGYSLAEAHVLRDLHKKKMTMEEEEERGKLGTAKGETVRSSTSCFFWMYLKKNVHSRNAQSQGTCSAQTSEVETLDHKV
ncbi:hypothetical protein Pyn_20635 [Prunus yedoensis var. nudiflora]|uniref:Uncharacterized protein n=1 Tax=Prunus yedoensis var. nudiflora TaxID=2094558 RepID=A0A314UY60_PRUYE|nr:hypothetical protein Pyn_20635 [Prunus yedoensis var. nudiflora]